MKDSLLEKYKLQKRLAKLESLLIEKSVGRGGEPSNAMKVWQLLTDNGPMTRQQIQSSGLSATATAGASLNFYVAHDLLTKTGDRFAANPDYAWDDIGVIPRTAQQELMNAVRNAEDADDDTADGSDSAPSENEAPVGRRRTAREPRQPRQPRVREVRANLFSRKYDEVKAAIDAGQDPATVKNEKGMSPLVYACRDTKGKSSEIIKLLLDHGANPNDMDGTKPVIFTLLTHNDTEGAKEIVKHGADLDAVWRNFTPLSYAMDNEIYDDTLLYLIRDGALNNSPFLRGFISRLSSAHIDGKISDALYKEIIDKASHGVDFDHIRNLDSGSITDELNHGITVLCDLFTSRGELPPMRLWGWHLNRTRAMNSYYDLLVRAANGELRVRDVGVFLDNCETVSSVLGKPNDFMLSFVTEDWLKQADNRSINDLIYHAIENNDVKVLSKIANIKNSTLEPNDIISKLAREDVSKQINSIVCRILNYCLKKNSKLWSSVIENVRKSRNAYLIEYLIERGFADTLLYGIIDVNNTSALSPTFKKVVKDLGIIAKDWRDDHVRQQMDTERRRASMIDVIIDKIRSDEWSRECEKYITENPDLLFDERIQDELDDPKNADSFTVTQLKRRIDRMPKDPEKYDF